MTQLKTIITSHKHDKPILVDTLYNNNYISKPIIIFCHGYKGFKDWGAWHLMGKSFVSSNFCFIKFNFSHNGGTIDQPIDFPDLEAFGQNNYTRELSDLNSVLNWIETEFKNDLNFNTSNITLMGHSRGGGIATIKADEDPRVKHLITLAGVSDYKKKFPKDEALKTWQKQGVMYVLNGRTKQQMPHYYQFYKDFIENEERLTIKRAVTKLDIPHLIIHGDADTTVLPQEAYNLHAWSPKSILKILEGADHVFNTKHPWNSDHLSEELEKVVAICLEFLKE